MKEREWMERVIALARAFGWRIWHVPMPVRPVGGGRFVPDPRGAGLLDLTLLHDDPPRLILAEVKGDGGRLESEQREFFALAKAVAERAFDWPPDVSREDAVIKRIVGVYAWWPTDEPQVETILRSKVLS